MVASLFRMTAATVLAERRRDVAAAAPRAPHFPASSSAECVATMKESGRIAPLARADATCRDHSPLPTRERVDRRRRFHQPGRAG